MCDDGVVYAFDFFGSDLKFREQKFMTKEKAEEYAIKTKTIFKLNIANKI